MKRALSAWALALALTIPAALPASAAAFSDVAADAWYAQAVEEVTAAGLMNGLLAMVILANPLMSWFALSTVWGVYLAASGVALAAGTLAASRS